MNFELMKRRKLWYAISLLFIIPGIISLFLQGLNLGIDFRGGAIMELQFDLDSGSEVQMAGEQNVFMRIQHLSQTERDKLVKAFEKEIGPVKVVKEDNVGPKIGRELAINALLSLLAASVMMIIYITWRFEFRSGLATVAALLHDVLITVGMFSIFQLDVDSAFVAAILTIIGYSINNTIVVFDRVRENQNKKREFTDLGQLLDTSIKQSVTRSVNTTLTVWFVTLAIYFLGGATLQNFMLAIIIGITAGLYSSLLIASSLWFDFKKGKIA
jgi:preprotein translocase subunit SecF